MKNKEVEKFILALYNDYYMYIYKLCLVKTRDPEMASDCCQETFKTAMDKLAKNDLIIQNPRAWITTLAGYTIKSFVRDRAINYSRHVEINSMIDEISDDNLLIENLLEKVDGEAIDINAIIDKIKNNLKSKDYELYEDFYREGRSIQDISKKLGISYEAVATRATRLKLKIKKILYSFAEF